MFFDALVAACGCPAGEVLMVGDDPVNDVQGAIEAGLQAVWLDRERKPADEGGGLPGTGRPSAIGTLSQLEEWFS